MIPTIIGAVLLAAYSILLIIIGLEDAFSLKIRNSRTASMAGIGLAAMACSQAFSSGPADVANPLTRILLYPTPASRLAGLFCISIPLLLLALLLPGSIGGGDIKLMGAAGLVLGREMVTGAFLAGIFLAGIFSLGLLVLGLAKREDAIPFGPFLCLGLLLVPLLAGVNTQPAFLTILKHSPFIFTP